MRIQNILLFTLLFLFSMPGHAKGQHPAFSNEWMVTIGMFLSKNDTEISLDASNGSAGTDVNFEDDLDFDESTTLPYVNVHWRFWDKYRLGLEYLEINRDNGHRIDKTIHWGDDTFNSNAKVESEFDISVARLFVGYSFLRKTDREAGVAMGAHLMNFDARLSGEVTVNGNTVINRGDDADGTAPLPNIGLYGAYALSDKWLLNGRFDWFAAKIGDYKGRLLSFDVGVQYQAFEHVGFGANYRLLDLDIEGDSNDWEGDAHYRYHGPSLFMTVNF